MLKCHHFIVFLFITISLSSQIVDESWLHISNNEIIAEKAIKENEEIPLIDNKFICIPKNLPLIEQAEEITGSDLYEDQKVFLILMAAKNDSKLLPSLSQYLETIPSEFSTPLYWSKEQLNEILGTQVYSITAQVRETVKEDAKLVFQVLHQQRPDMFPKDKFGNKALLWAKTIWRTRIVVKNDLDCFHPIYELFDYSKQPNVLADTSGDVVVLKALRDIKTNERVWITDGYNFTQAELLDYYGIVSDFTRYSYPLGLQLDRSESDKMFSWKLSLFSDRNLVNGQSFPMYDGEISKNLLYALRVYFLTIYESDEVENLYADKQVTVQNEISVYQALANLCSRKLEHFVSTVEEDEKILSSDERKDDTIYRMSVRYRLEEKKILNSVIKIAEEKLSVLSAEWSTRTLEVPKVINL